MSRVTLPSLSILHVLYYYAPHRSGLTIYAERLCRELAARGHRVTVICARHDRSLPARELRDGVDVLRLFVAASFSRAVFAPALIPAVAWQMRSTNVVHLNLPLAEAAPIATLARAMRKRLVTTHMADLDLQGSMLERVASNLALGSGIAAGRLSHAVATNTSGRAATSPTIRRLRDNVHVIAPPIADPEPAEPRDLFKARFGLGTGPLVGFVGRMVFEKGIDVLAASMPALIREFPTITFAFAGPTTGPGGALSVGSWDIELEKHAAHVRRLGPLSWADLSSFYAACELIVLPSTNITETFGMVQVEAMLAGTPVVASDLDGVCEPIERTGMGRLARAGDAADLGSAIRAVLIDRDMYLRPAAAIRAVYSLDATVSAYEHLYHDKQSS